jgi:small subunit ribosomal protein S1
MLETLGPARRRVDGWASSLRFAGVYVARPLPARRSVSIDPETMEELLATETAQRSLRPLRVGETVEGTIAAVAGHEATVDLGDLPAGVISLNELGSEELRVGDQVVAVVRQLEGPDGRIVLSLRRDRNRKQWAELEAMQKNGTVIDAAVLEANRGGVVVDVGLRGFVPLSQLVAISSIDTRAPGVPEALKALVGRHLQVRVLEADPTRDRLIVSEKAAAQQLRRERKARGTTELAVGDVLSGVVVGVTSYGLFVDVGVADGLVHRSEITWEKGVDPISVRRLGDGVQVVVVGVDRDRQRISLSIKRLGADPWEQYVNQIEAGQTMNATVTRVMPYGAFARVADGVEGLIHVSELGRERVADPNAAVRVGELIPVRIVAVDRERRRLSLSARLAERTSTLSASRTPPVTNV